MPNSVYQQFNQNNDNILSDIFQNPQQLMNKINEFRQTFLQGDPAQIGQTLLQTGRMSQSEYNQYRQMALQLMKILPFK